MSTLLAGSTAPRRGRVRAGGRSEAVRRAVARAALDLLGEGRVDLAPTEVARRAGVTRATIYRWWPTKADLVREALALHTHDLAVPDTGTWAGDVAALAHQLAAFFAQPVEVAQNAIMASGDHPAYTEIVLDHYAPLFAGWRGMVERARERGQVRVDVDADTALLTLTSPLLVLPLVMRRTPSPAEVDAIVELVVVATSA